MQFWFSNICAVLLRRLCDLKGQHDGTIVFLSCCFPSAVSMLSDYEMLEFVWLVKICLIRFAKTIIVLNFEDHCLRSGSYLLNNVVNRHGARADSVRKIVVSYYHYYFFSNKHLEICSCASGSLAA